MQTKSKEKYNYFYKLLKTYKLNLIVLQFQINYLCAK